LKGRRDEEGVIPSEANGRVEESVGRAVPICVICVICGPHAQGAGGWEFKIQNREFRIDVRVGRRNIRNPRFPVGVGKFPIPHS
jgi:hypothetical protein